MRCRTYSPASANLTFVVARPLNDPPALVPGVPVVEIFSISGRGLSKVTVPGPRYFDQRAMTGGRGVLIGALVPLVNFPSSDAHTVSANGDAIDAVRAGAVARFASGPCVGAPFSSNRICGGVLPTAISLNGLIT